MWMLVNTTIFSDVAELQLMIDAMISQLDKQLIESCNTDIVSDPNTDDDGDDRNCEWEEYTETKEYLEKVIMVQFESFSNSVLVRLTTSSRRRCSRETMITAA